MKNIILKTTYNIKNIIRIKSKTNTQPYCRKKNFLNNIKEYLNK